MKVSVIIPTFNRFDFLINTIKSIKNQTHNDMEIIVVNDGSTDERYNQASQTISSLADVVWVNLPINSGKAHGFRCRAYVLNYGMGIFKGDFVSFCDDDDSWMPQKIEKQLKAMELDGAEMSCTEAYMGKGMYDKDKKYPLYNKKWFWGILRRKYENKNLLGFNKDSDNFPKIWDEEWFRVHNCAIGCSVVISRNVVKKVGLFNESRNYKKGQDYEYWKRAIKHTKCSYLYEPLAYYDGGHGSGQQY